jgi:hypothetical protein
MNAFGRALEYQLRSVITDLFATMEGIPEEDLNSWKPVAAREGGHEMNTFAAMAIHVVSAAEFMTLHAVGGAPSNRNREGEFSATGSLSDIRARFDAWLDGLHAVLEGLSEDDLNAPTAEPRYIERGWPTAEVLLHALDHTALHVGHMQVQRQLWESERGQA